MYCHQYDLIQLHRQIIHQNDGISMSNSLKPFSILKKENNENDMAAHGICFDFYYQPKPSQFGQNGLAATSDARLADVSLEPNN